MGYDEGAVMIKIGREEPVASMDASGKIIYARHNDVQTVNIRQLGADAEEVRRCCDSELSNLPHHLVLVSLLRYHWLYLCLRSALQPILSLVICAQRSVIKS